MKTVLKRHMRRLRNERKKLTIKIIGKEGLFYLE